MGSEFTPSLSWSGVEVEARAPLHHVVDDVRASVHHVVDDTASTGTHVVDDDVVDDMASTGKHCDECRGEHRHIMC